MRRFPVTGISPHARQTAWNDTETALERAPPPSCGRADHGVAGMGGRGCRVHVVPARRHPG